MSRLLGASIPENDHVSGRAEPNGYRLSVLSFVVRASSISEAAKTKGHHTHAFTVRSSLAKTSSLPIATRAGSVFAGSMLSARSTLISVTFESPVLLQSDFRPPSQLRQDE